jgi:ribosomal protein S6--L-glutamate ligase
MRIAIISLEGKSSKAVAKECEKYFDQVDMLKLKEFEVKATNNKINVTHLKQNLEQYDCIYVRGSYRYALLQRSITRAFLGESYMPIKPKAFTLGHDKFLTLLELQKNDVAIPKTYYAATTKLAKKILQEVEYPVIMKVQEGTHGKGVMIAESEKSAKTILDLLEDFKKPFVIQEFVPTNQTSDIRVIVAGNKVIAAYKRVAAEQEIRSNIHAGGTRLSHELTKEQEELALKSAEAIGADICGVDILDSKNPSVIEVNLSPAFARLQDITDINVPKKIAQILYLRTKRFKKRMKEKIRKKKKKAVKK